MLIHNFLEKAASRFSDKVAIVHEQTRATYRQINVNANRLAFFLNGRSVKKGDRVVILMENCCEYVIAYYAILKTGAIAVPLSTDIKPDGLNALLEELEPSAIISSVRFERLLKASDLNVPNLKTIIIQNLKSSWDNSAKLISSFDEILELPEHLNEVNIGDSDLASIIYTSGSTGKPKGVMLTHGNIVSNTNSICQYLQLKKNDTQMVVLPFFYVMGKSLLNTIFAVGGTIVINNKFAFPATMINQMIDENVTLFSGVPSTYAYLLHRSPFKKSKDRLKYLRMVTQAGGHMARSVKESLRENLPEHTKICIMYGATEASARLSWLDPGAFEQKIDSIGQSIPGVTIRILGSNGKELPAGATGEVVASGPNIMQGYWKDSEATANVLSTDGYNTGDMGYKDDEGFIFLEGRKDNLMKVGGHRISLQEVEDALLATRLVVEVAVVGLTDDLLGKRLAALVVPLNGDTLPEEIKEKCSKIIPKHKLPSEIRLLRSLPKNANGKVDRNRCLKLFAIDIQ